jgi:hypothetical protein
MPASFVQRAGQNDNTGSTASLGISVASACPAGDSVLVVFRSPSNGTVASVADSESNSYTQEYAPGSGIYVYRSNLTTALTTSDTITVAFTAAQADGIYAVADLFADLGTYDVSNYVASTVHSSPATLAITARQDDEVIYAACINFAASISTSVTGSTAFTATGAQLEPATGTTSNCILTAYDAAPNAGSITASFTYSPVGNNWAIILLAYRQPPAPQSGLLMTTA